MQHMMEQRRAIRQRVLPFPLVIAAILTVCAAVSLTVLAPHKAFAKSYTMPKVDIQAQVETDGSFHVTEQRTFSFDGSFEAVWWSFYGIPSQAEVHINGVRLVPTGGSDSVNDDVKTLESVPFVLQWRESGGPGKDAYSFDQAKNTAYVFFGSSPKNVIVELDYTVTNAVQAYEDIGELYWQYVGTQWSASSENVSATVSLPVPQGTEVTPGNNVRAWGHGPNNGQVSVNADGTVGFSVSHVPEGVFAESRIVFPRAWLTNLSAQAVKEHVGETRLDSVVKEEKEWADKANYQRLVSLVFMGSCAIVCVAVLAWALIMYFRYGKEYEPQFKDEYWRDVPDKGTHPALIGRLWRWGAESSNDLTATVMRLANQGSISLEQRQPSLPSDSDSKNMGKEATDYLITKLPASEKVTDPIDKAALDLLFGTVADGALVMSVSSIAEYGKENPEGLTAAFGDWQAVVSAEEGKHDYYEKKGWKLRRVMVAVGAIVIVAGIALAWFNTNLVPVFFAIPTGIALFVIGNYMPRRTREANELTAKSKALRNWLRDFSSLDERPPSDVKVWGEFMIYAYLFGVAKEAIKQLRIAEPQLFASEMPDYSGNAGLPWWCWYTGATYAGSSSVPAIGDFFDQSWENALASAQTALDAAKDAANGGSFGGGFSSGDGFGGGFSGGGGGGFGSGGGAR